LFEIVLLYIYEKRNLGLATAQGFVKNIAEDGMRKSVTVV